jgi:hypothetical protein
MNSCEESAVPDFTKLYERTAEWINCVVDVSHRLDDLFSSLRVAVALSAQDPNPAPKETYDNIERVGGDAYSKIEELTTRLKSAMESMKSAEFSPGESLVGEVESMLNDLKQSVDDACRAVDAAHEAVYDLFDKYLPDDGKLKDKQNKLELDLTVTLNTYDEETKQLKACLKSEAAKTAASTMRAATAALRPSDDDEASTSAPSKQR